VSSQTIHVLHNSSEPTLEDVIADYFQTLLEERLEIDEPCTPSEGNYMESYKLGVGTKSQEVLSRLDYQEGSEQSQVCVTTHVSIYGIFVTEDIHEVSRYKPVSNGSQEYTNASGVHQNGPEWNSNFRHLIKWEHTCVTVVTCVKC